ncbi:MAG: TetR/AcrR family transcriptional regulator [Anaerolineae bacterium]
MKTSAREIILETASQMFFQQGVRAVGIDTIVEQSGVAKMTLYRYFPSKDDLIVAYLEDSNAKFWVWFDEAISGEGLSGRERLLALFGALQKLVSNPQCYGCPFLNAATEFPERTHPGHGVALAHKRLLIQRLSELAEAAGAVQPAALAQQLLTLMDGAFMQVRMFGVDNPAQTVAQAAAALIECQTS